MNAFALKFPRNPFPPRGEIAPTCSSATMANTVNIVCAVTSVAGNLNFHVAKMDLLRNTVAMDVEP